MSGTSGEAMAEDWSELDTGGAAVLTSRRQGAMGGHSNRLCTNTRDRGQERDQAVKAENLEGQAVKGTSQIRKSQGSSKLKVNRIPNLIKAKYHIL